MLKKDIGEILVWLCQSWQVLSIDSFVSKQVVCSVEVILPGWGRDAKL